MYSYILDLARLKKLIHIFVSRRLYFVIQRHTTLCDVFMQNVNKSCILYRLRDHLWHMKYGRDTRYPSVYNILSLKESMYAMLWHLSLPLINSLRPSDAYMRHLTTVIDSDNGLSPDRRQVIFGTNDGIVLITPTPYIVFPLFATRFAAYTGGIRISFIQPRLF